MTKLEIVKRIWLESGAGGSEPTTTVGATGETLRFSRWADTAYEYVQNLHFNWDFLRTDFSFNTEASKSTYSLSEAGVSDLCQWKVKDVRLYSSVNDEGWIEYYDWDCFRNIYLLGSMRSKTGRPEAFSIKPDRSIIFGQIPNGVYNVNGEYWKVADTFASESAEPIIPTRYQLVIVWKALMLYGAYENAIDAYSHGETEYKKAIVNLEDDQLPRERFLEPLV